MNWLAILVIVFLAIYVARGYHNGLIKTVFSICAVFIALVVACFGSSILGDVLKDNKTVYEAVNKKVVETLQIDSDAKTASDQESYINSLPLPERVRTALEENNNKKVYELMDTSKFEDYVSGYITCMILNALAFVVLFVVTLILVRVLANVLDIISRLPVLHTLNKIGGLALGLLHGLVILWILCIALTIAGGTGAGKECFKAINESEFLSFLYNNNLLLHFVVNAAQTLTVFK